MPLNTMNVYMVDLLAGTTSPFLAPLRTVRSSDIPTPGKYDAVDIGGVMRPVPYGFIHVGVGHEQRQTMPRPVAWKKTEWTTDVILQAVLDPDSTDIDKAMDCLVDAVTMTLNQTEMPVIVTDPDTLYQSQVLSVGEELHYEVFIPDVVSFGGQNYVRHAVRISCTVKEATNYR